MPKNRKNKRRLIEQLKALISKLNSEGRLWKNGAAEGTRTPDPIITNDVLYQLSYSGILLIDGPTMALLKPQPAA